MRVLPIQQRVLPGLVKGVKSLPKEVAALGTAATAVASGAMLGSKGGDRVYNSDGEGCGSVEAVCTPLLNF